MKEEKKTTALSRRKFFKSAGLLAGGIVAASAPMMAKAAVPPLPRNADQTIKVGILRPRSQIYPTMGDNLTQGMKLCLDQHDSMVGSRKIEIIPKDIGPHAGDAVKAFRSLAEDKDTDLVVGILSSPVAANLRETCEETKTVLIVSDIGARMPYQNEKSPFIFRNTFNYWQSHWAMGQWAAKHQGKRCMIVSSLYDTGYDSIYAFRRGFDDAGGTVMGQARIIGEEPLGSPVSDVISEISKDRPDMVYALFHDHSALTFAKAYSDAGLARDIPLLGSGFMTDERLLPAMEKTAIGMKTCLPWSPTLETAENKAFATAYQKSTGTLPDAFAVLGYDTGQLIINALNAADGKKIQKARWMKALANVRFTSPRGDFRMNPETHSAVTPLYLREVRPHRGKTANIVIGNLNPVSEDDERFASLRNGLRSGLTQAYLVA